MFNYSRSFIFLVLFFLTPLLTSTHSFADVMWTYIGPQYNHHWETGDPSLLPSYVALNHDIQITITAPDGANLTIVDMKNWSFTMTDGTTTFSTIGYDYDYSYSQWSFQTDHDLSQPFYFLGANMTFDQTTGLPNKWSINWSEYSNYYNSSPMLITTLNSGGGDGLNNSIGYDFSLQALFSFTLPPEPWEYTWLAHRGDGTSYQGGVWTVTGSWTIPEPATMLLLGCGLIGLAGFRRKFKQ